MTIGLNPLIMGVLNVTPDSFYDKGKYFDTEKAIHRGVTMAEEGADIIDVGGESTRPGALPVSPEDEMRRVLPVIRGLAGQTSALLSVDTTKSVVAEACLEAGAHVVNDISALTADPQMPDVIRKFRAGAVLMHCQGTPATMQDNPHYTNVTREVHDYLSDRLRNLAEFGLDRETMAIDPCIGFGKTLEHNLKLIANINQLTTLGRPVMVGVSRKSLLGKLLKRESPDRLAASLGVAVYCAIRGAQILRVHDVRETKDALTCLNALTAEEN